jgi:hypothetical protein
MAYHPIELMLEWETRTNQPRERAECREEILSLWTTLGTALVQVPRIDPPELMIVLTTYARPRAAAQVLSKLREALARAELTDRAALLVLHDACGHDYAHPRRSAEQAAPQVLWLDARQRLGKAAFWKTHQTALTVAQAWRPRLALYLQDDVDFEPDLITRALELWRATQSDPLRRVLYLFSSSDDEASGRWVHFKRRAAGPCRLTNWFDLQGFLVDREFFELLAHRMVPIHANRWRRRPEQSSGVGRQFTRRLFGRAHVYQAWPPLLIHGTEPSTMNPEAREARSLDNRSDYVPSSRWSAA